jgi:TatD DNase family protein
MRDALDDGVAILEDYAGHGLTGVTHCFAGDEHHAARCLAIGLHVSFAGPLTFTKADEVRAVALTVPLERTLLETDSPFLAPQPIRGKTNEPAAVRWVAEKQAEIRGLEVREVVTATTASARSLFGIGVAA